MVCNIGIYDKVMRGFYAAAISLLGDATAYPVINSAVFYLDDFPSPVPSGDGTYIKRDYGPFHRRTFMPRSGGPICKSSRRNTAFALPA